MSEFTNYQYKKYARDKFVRYKKIKCIMWFLYWSGLPVFLIYLVFVRFTDEDLIPLLFVIYIFFMMLPVVIAASALDSRLDSYVENAMNNESNNYSERLSQIKEEIVSMSSSIGDIKSTGHFVMAGDGTTVIIDSSIINSFNKIEKSDPELAEAIKIVSGAIERSDNKEAGESWSRLLKELSGSNDKIVMKSLWKEIISLVPSVKSLAESVSIIVKLFS